MRRFSILAIALVALMVLSVPAFAATQNVKVSGDITLRGLYHEQYDLNETKTDSSDEYAWFQTVVGINVDADLTDNVSTQIRIVNQRDSQVDNNSSDLDIDLDLANVTMKELFYSPLTVTLGRQDLWYGKGFIVGSALLVGGSVVDPNAATTADEYGEFTAFDAIRATLDLDPWTIDGLYSKIDENSAGVDDDIDLYGVNIGYQFEDYNAEAEGYYFVKKNRATADRSNITQTLGLRGSAEFLANFVTYGEIGYQFGDYSTSSDVKRDRDAWALDIGADYTWVDVNWMPKLGVEYIYYSGEEVTDTNDGAASDDYEGWDPMYRGKFDSVIREFAVSLYGTDDASDQAATSNQHQFAIDGTICPMEDVALRARYTYFVADEEYVANRDDEIGHEIDLIGTYNYTEDVTCSLVAAWFIPGDYYSGATSTSKYDDTATSVVGTVKVMF